MGHFRIFTERALVCLCRILGGRALGLGFSRPKVSMSLVSEHDLKQSHSEQRPYSVIAGTMSECSFATDTSGCCKAEFHSIHVEKLQPLNGKNAAIQKYAFVFRTAVNICGCQIPLEVCGLLLFRSALGLQPAELIVCD